jgi:uncharacterized protein (TIGR03067 family)
VKKLTAIVAVVLIATSSLRSDPPPDEAKAIQGSWTPVVFQLAGKSSVAGKRLQYYRLTLTDEKYVLKSPGANEEGTLVLRPDKNPKEMDIIGTAGPSKGKTYLAIYQLVGSQLYICYDLSGKQRPVEFRAKADSTSLFAIYRRE